MIQLALWGEPRSVYPSPAPYPSPSLPAPQGFPSVTNGEGAESVIAELRWLNRRCGPVSAAHLAGFVGKSPRMTQYYLNRLESAGAVQRVGRRGGWLVAGR